MSSCNYLCHIVGEPIERARRHHPSTQKRMKAFAIAIHIPVILWAVTGYMIASRVFRLDATNAAALAAFCAGLIYLVERLVLSAPKAWHVNMGRVAIGIVIAVLGASTIDLVIFDREVEHQLRQAGLAKLKQEYETAIANQSQVVSRTRADWLKAQEDANCEANGTCGSKIRSTGPVYRQLARQAELLRTDHAAAQSRLDELTKEKTTALAEWGSSATAVGRAGLLTRIEALHQYTMENKTAFIAWLLFFLLLLFFELIVVFVKLVFGETVDDKIDIIREQISHQKAADYMEAMTSPLGAARKLVETSLCR